MKPGSWLINTSRGEVLDEQALLRSLERRQLAGAALDVLTDEGGDALDRNHPLLVYARNNPNLLITPHLGGCTCESMEKTEVFLAQKLCEALRLGESGMNASVRDASFEG
jgi:D-3-phosphoglycerate dehydrogenase